MELILKYFPQLTQGQIQNFSSLPALYNEWNSQINVISRKDVENLYERHILHSLSIAKFIQFKNGAKVMDLGTGGGFPGIPLAILYPDCRFHLVDSIGKKLKVVEAVKESLGLKNVFTFHSRAEQMDYQYDFVVSRAVAPVADLLSWTKGKYFPKNQHSIRNGLICLKGGNVESETTGVKGAQKTPVSSFFDEAFFKDKFIVYCPQ
ncbi:MAG TPA: 16S rRNA (guanine(527)-N(7))-methyltransferase RsmG [Chitinophagales bacterium]|nr:16S rRNA (guanine(527)-N(7))-methyltransferase RsmG [Chitinophagales bacterium]